MPQQASWGGRTRAARRRCRLPHRAEQPGASGGNGERSSVWTSSVRCCWRCRSRVGTNRRSKGTCRVEQIPFAADHATVSASRTARPERGVRLRWIGAGARTGPCSNRIASVLAEPVLATNASSIRDCCAPLAAVCSGARPGAATLVGHGRASASSKSFPPRRLGPASGDISGEPRNRSWIRFMRGNSTLARAVQLILLNKLEVQQSEPHCLLAHFVSTCQGEYIMMVSCELIPKPVSRH